MEMFQVFFIESMIFYSVNKRVLSLEGNVLLNGAKSNDDAFILKIAILTKWDHYIDVSPLIWKQRNS